MTSIPNPQLPLPATFTDNPNSNTAALFVNGLARAGLRHVIIAPGSRSTPLTLAFAAHPDIQVQLYLDERSGAFFALGMALALNKPVALVCTSGTAVANFLPAVVEAKMSHIPLLLLTGDRPHELRHSGANQTIDQIKLYGDQVLWSIDMALPEAKASDLTHRHITAMAVRAYATANGIVKGPVHINFPFRKPLQPEIGAGTGQEQSTKGGDDGTPIPAIQRGELILTRNQEQAIADLINRHERGLIICGPRCPGGNFPQAVAGLSQMSGYPIMADPLSGVRWGRHASSSVIVGGYETYMQGKRNWPEPDIIIRFGAVPTSKWLNNTLNQINPVARIHIRENGVWADDTHRITHFVQANAENACYQIAQSLQPRLSSDWLNQVSQTETAVWQAMAQHLPDPWFDASVVADMVELMPGNSSLFVGNSLPIRHLDQFGQPGPKLMRVFGNRGASGIDGNLSTGLGVAAALKRPTVLLVGDITFLHDLNGLFPIANDHAAAGNRPRPVTIVLLNNNGGNIFRRLPIHQIDPPFTNLFLTPHGLELEPVIRMFGLDYVAANNRDDFRTAFAASLKDKTPRVIEVQTDGEFDDARRRELVQIINNAL